jgi:allophanate hydrolase
MTVLSGTPAFDIATLQAFYRQGGSVADIVDAVFARIAAVDDPGIFIHLADKASVMAEAEMLGAFDPDKPLYGIPFAVKDNIDVAGMPTTAGCPDYAYLPACDATVVRLLRQAGALVVGKTNLDQFATGLVGVRSPYPIPRNAIDPALVPGGSSSGSAVATAQGIVSFALGTDTAGSGRVPAGLNNIVGLKPSLGALSTSGVVPACRTLDCVSIFALTVDDAWRVFEIAACPDDADAYSRDLPALGYGNVARALTVGVPARADLRFFGDTRMEAAFADAQAMLRSLGHRVVELPFDDFYKVAALLYEGAWVAERYAAIRDFFDAHEDRLHPVTRGIYGKAKHLTAADAFEGLYALQALKKTLAGTIASVDMLCVPTAPTHYTLKDLEAEPLRENARLGTYTNFVNLLDMCGMAVPTGTRDDGLPASVTLLAAAGKDGLTATVARDLHLASGLTLGATGWPQPEPSAPGIRPNDDSRIDLVVVGAHLSGMPLNHQLTDLGAELRRAAFTSSAYRLYALAETAPPKPGMVRVPQDAGGKIAVEVWSMTTEAFGRFVAAIPAPLGVGTVTLADGTSAKGFLAEPIALDQAHDITHHGGWRAYCEHLSTAGEAARAAS